MTQAPTRSKCVRHQHNPRAHSYVRHLGASEAPPSTVRSLASLSRMQQRTHSDSVTVHASAQAVYELISDIGRTGEWSPTCVGCEWDDPDRRGVGATFTGYNEASSRSWQTTSTIIVADPGVRFGWEVGDGFVRWSYDLRAFENGTELTETWTFLPAGLEHFANQYGDQAATAIETRTQRAAHDIPQTLARIKQIAEAT